MKSGFKPSVLSMYTRDGVRLDADVYMPEGDGPFPVLLMRQPYGRRIASTVVYAHPIWYVHHGYLVVIQDVRGRGSSEGAFEPFIHEKEDGYDTLDWVATLPGSNGCVGMYGFSYHGMTQLFAAASGNSALKVIAPAMAASDLYRHWAYEGDAFRLYGNMTWAAQLGAETARRSGSHALYARLHQMGHGPTGGELIDPAGLTVRQTLADTFYSEWMDNDAGSSYWCERSAGNQLAGVNIPALHIGGWFDSFLSGTLANYDILRQSGAPQRLVIGPWTHLPWTPAVGSVWLGESAQSPVDRMQLRWFDRFLKDQVNGIDRASLVELYDLRAGRWIFNEDFPDPTPIRFYLWSNGLANLDLGTGCLVDSPRSSADDIFVLDPWRPVPTTGGHLGPSLGIHDRTAIDARPDVTTYTTEPFINAVQLAGAIKASLAVDSDAISFDLSAVLSVVDVDGRSRNLTQGYSRITGSGGPHRVDLRATCALVRAGERLRLSVSGSCYPAFALNDGSGRNPGTIGAADYKVITLCLRPERSWLELPLTAAQGDDVE